MAGGPRAGRSLPVLRGLGLTVPLGVRAQARPSATSLRLLLNTSLSGPAEFLALAQARGHLRDERIELQRSGGPGAAAMVPMVRDGACDAGYGDLSARIERIASGPADAGPVAIFTTFNVVPFTIAVSAAGPIKAPRDLEGRRITGHASDAALLNLDLYARTAGVDARRVEVDGSMGGTGPATADMLGGRGADGVFGFVNTIIASAAPLGVDPAALRFPNGSEVLPDVCGNPLFVTRETCRREPQVPHRLVRALDRALALAVREPGATIEALLARAGQRPRGEPAPLARHAGDRNGTPRRRAHRHRRNG